MRKAEVLRKDYLDFLKSFRNKDLIKVVSGVRRSGKSTLLKQYRDYLLADGVATEQILFINFEDYLWQDLAEPKKIHDYILEQIKPGQMNYIFLDEVQNIPDFELVTNSIKLRDNIDLYLTSSNSYLLSGKLATLLAGRYVELRILPLSFQEFVRWHQENGLIKSTEEYFTDYLVSSFPYTLYLYSREEVFYYLEGIYNTVVLKDIVKRLNIDNVRLLQQVIECLMSSIGSLVNVNKLANTVRSENLSISNNTMDRYIGGILAGLLMYSAKRFDIRGRRLLQTQEKFYSVDIGLRNFILRDHQENFGHILENIVFLELLRRKKKVFVGKLDEYEVDFVTVDKNNVIEYYQVALTTLDEQALSRKLRPLQKIKDNYQKTLLHLDTYKQHDNYNGIEKVPLLSWLLQE